MCFAVEALIPLKGVQKKSPEGRGLGTLIQGDLNCVVV